METKKDRVTAEAMEEIVIDEKKEKALKTGYITLYTKFFTVILSTGTNCAFLSARS